jgi:hypothetical protein
MPRTRGVLRRGTSRANGIAEFKMNDIRQGTVHIIESFGHAPASLDFLTDADRASADRGGENMSTTETNGTAPDAGVRSRDHG